MRDFYLMFDDEAAFAAAHIEREPGIVEVDEVGERVRVLRPAAIGEDGVTIEPAEFETLPGWRVNLRVADDRDMAWIEPCQVYPARPARVWA